MSVLMMVMGAGLVLAGRQLFWLAVGAMGFVTGIVIARQELGLDGSNGALLIALACGLAGMLLAILLQKVAIAVVGFLALGYVAITVLSHQGVSQEWQVVGYILAGLVGAGLMSAFFEWALIPLTAVVGSLILVQELALNPPVDLLVLILLSAAGMAIQWRGERPRRRVHDRRDDRHANT